MYRAYITRASSGELDNSQRIEEILRLRKRLASILGYNNYAEMSLARKMISSVEQALSFEEDLRKSSWQSAQRELQELKDFAKQSGFEEELAHWDMGFWAKRYEEKLFSYTEEELRQYFSLDRVLAGMFQLVEDLFQVTVRNASGETSVWHEDVMFFKIFDKSNQHIASFFLDPYSRPETKRPGAWMDDCQGRRRFDDGKVRLPVAYLICNGTPPAKEQPALLTFREVETLFHEFGHGLQHMLTVIDYYAAGINGVEWDAVELPSQFMENWCYHKRTLLGIAKHVKTGETMNDELFEKVSTAELSSSFADVKTAADLEF